MQAEVTSISLLELESPFVVQFHLSSATSVSLNQIIRIADQTFLDSAA